MEVAEKLKAITSGFANYAFPSDKMEWKAIKRAEICSGCEHAVGTVLTAIMPDKKEMSVTGMKCNLCKCFLPAKVRQDIQRCPIQKW